MVLIFPNTTEEAFAAPAQIHAPLIYVNSEGNRLGRPILYIQELEHAGYKMVNDAISAISVMFEGVKDLLVHLKDTGRSGLQHDVAILIRKDVEDTIGLEEFYKVEEETVEKTEPVRQN